MPRRGRAIRLFLAAALAVILAQGAPPPAAAAGGTEGTEGTLYAGPAADPAFGELAPDLLTALFPGHRLALVPTEDAAAALDHVAAAADALAIADLAAMLDAAAVHALPPGRLVFAGQLSRRCLLAFARRGGWVRGFADIAAAAGTPRPAIGLVGREGAGTLAALARLDPGLAGLDVQPGDAAQLTARVMHGSLDLLLVVAEPGFDDATVATLADDDRLVTLPVVTRLLTRAAATGEGGFTLAAYRPDGLSIAWTAPPPTLCTPIGVVLRDDAPAALRRDLGPAAASVAAGLRRPATLGGRAAATVKSVLRDVVGPIRGWLGDP